MSVIKYELVEINEELREFCCNGDIEGVYKCLSEGADVNSKNEMNGWTPLHWASKRGHTNLVQILLNASADPYITNHKGETPVDVAFNIDLSNILKNFSYKKKLENNESHKPNHVKSSQQAMKIQQQRHATFLPNYLKHPHFPYISKNLQYNESGAQHFNYQDSMLPCKMDKKYDYHDHNLINDNEVVLKIRVADSAETDFIEIELMKNELTYNSLFNMCISELEIDLTTYTIRKLRKLPNTILRKDKDISRLTQFQEIEVVLS